MRRTVAMMRRRADSAVKTGGGSPQDLRIARFDLTERVVHWCTALVGLTLIFTGAILYVPAFSVAFGRRLLVENLHLFVGLAVFVPVLLGALIPAGRQLRSDLRQMNRITGEEVTWLRSAGRRGRAALGKFNPGQKLNTFAIGGLLGVLFSTGIILRWGAFLPVGIRTGATFVHDLAAFAFVALVLGHVSFAFTHPVALRSMVIGWVPRSWAARHAPAWQTPQSGRRARS